MEIRISIHTTEPLTGTATAGSEEPVHFEGWLELLRALSTLIGVGGDLARGKPGASQDLPTTEGGSDGHADDSDVDDGPHPV
jgi:hypothetical protein